MGWLQEHASQGRNQPCAAVISAFVWLLSSTCGGDRIEDSYVREICDLHAAVLSELLKPSRFCPVTDAANVPESPSGSH